MPDIDWPGAIKEIAIWVGFAFALLKGIEGAVTAINAIDQSFRAMLARRSTKGLLILPTLEEVSRYSIKARQASDNFDPYYAFQHADELIERQNRILRRRELRMRNRLSMMILAFTVSFMTLASKFLWLIL